MYIESMRWGGYVRGCVEVCVEVCGVGCKNLMFLSPIL